MERNAFPALLVVPGREPGDPIEDNVQTYSYNDYEKLPSPDEVRGVVVGQLSDVWGNPADMLRDVYKDEVLIQHETPPTEPYDAYAIVIAFGQLPVQTYDGQVTNEDPFNLVRDALLEEYGVEIELWIDGVSVASGDGGDMR